MRRTTILVVGLSAVLLGGIAVLGGLRLQDRHSDRDAEARLMARQPAAPPRFRTSMVADLPEPARRFFRFAIAEGTPLRIVSVVDMTGELSLGTRGDPRYRPMVARQVLAPPHGFTWRVGLGGGARITGSDALTPETSWSRFRLLDAVPVARAGGDADHRRSSFGRLVADGLIWAPAAFLPAAGAEWDVIRWEGSGPDSAEVTVASAGLEQCAEIHVDDRGRLLRVMFERWSDENPERVHRLQPFGGDLSDFRTFDGFRLPTRAVAGNHYGTAAYHAFFRADVDDVTFPDAPP
jgi:hypothetical protein